MPHPPRVTIPENPAELLKLAADIYKHDQELGSKSPLGVMEGPPTWAEAGPGVATARSLQAQIEETERKLKDLYGQRQPHLDKLLPLVRSSRDLLLGVYSQNPRKLGDFGFEVKTTEASKVKATEAAKK